MRKLLWSASALACAIVLMMGASAWRFKGSFTFAGIGDLIIRTPITQLAEPAFQNLVMPLRDADVTFAKMEGALIDLDTFPALDAAATARPPALAF